MLRSSNSYHSIHLNSQITNHHPKALIKSKSLLYRNRSLKQFFGDLPALDAFPQAQRTEPSCQQKQNGRKGARRGGCGRGKEVEDEYLIKRRKGREEGARELSRGSKYKRKDIVDKAETNSHRTYDPSPYHWRKTRSKNQQRQSTHPLPYQPLIAHSQYYPTPKSSRNQVQAEDSAVQPAGRQQGRCNSSESLRKGVGVGRLKPRVGKDMFEGKGGRGRGCCSPSGYEM